MVFATTRLTQGWDSPTCYLNFYNTILTTLPPETYLSHLHFCTGAPLRFAPLHFISRTCTRTWQPAPDTRLPRPETRNDSASQRETGNRD